MAKSENHVVGIHQITFPPVVEHAFFSFFTENILDVKPSTNEFNLPNIPYNTVFV